MLANFSSAYRAHAISVIVLTASQATSPRINREMTGLLILRSHDLEVASLARDQNVGPAIRGHFLAILVLGYGAIVGNENRSPVPTLSNEIKGSDAGHQRYGCQRPHQHSVGHRPSP